MSDLQTALNLPRELTLVDGSKVQAQQVSLAQLGSLEAKRVIQNLPTDLWAAFAPLDAEGEVAAKLEEGRQAAFALVEQLTRGAVKADEVLGKLDLDGLAEALNLYFRRTLFVAGK